MREAAIILVSCCGEKLGHPAPARQLYQSQLFKLAARYAESTGHPWVILSAALGVVHPDQVIEPYERRLPTTRAGRQQWGITTAAALRQLAGDTPTRFISLCGSDYTDPLGDLTGHWHMSRYHPTGHTIECPMQGMGIGQRLRYLTQQLTPQLEAFHD